MTTENESHAHREGRRSALQWYLVVTFIVLAGVLLGGCSWLEEPEQEGLVIAFTPEADPVHLELDAQGLAAYLAQELGVPVEARVDADYMGTVEAMRHGHAHIATNLAPLQAAIAVERAGVRPILVEERDGQAEYRSCFWVLNDSGITELGELEGRAVAFNDPLSGSGYLMPVSLLVEEGLILGGEHLDDFFAHVSMAGGTEFSMRALINGTVDVAGISENAADVFLSPEERERVNCIARSSSMPRHAIAVSGDLDDDMVEAIRQAFLKLNEPDYNHLLEGLYGWRKVVQVDAEPYLPLLNKARDVGILDEATQGIGD